MTFYVLSQAVPMFNGGLAPVATPVPTPMNMAAAWGRGYNAVMPSACMRTKPDVEHCKRYVGSTAIAC